MIVSTLWLGAIGFIDDYIKVFKKDKKGLAGKFKILGQVFIGLLVTFIGIVTKKFFFLFFIIPLALFWKDDK